MAARFRLTPDAEAQIGDIVEYIAADSEDAAVRVRHALYSAGAGTGRGAGGGTRPAAADAGGFEQRFRSNGAGSVFTSKKTDLNAPSAKVPANPRLVSRPTRSGAVRLEGAAAVTETFERMPPAAAAEQLSSPKCIEEVS